MSAIQDTVSASIGLKAERFEKSDIGLVFPPIFPYLPVLIAMSLAEHSKWQARV